MQITKKLLVALIVVLLNLGISGCSPSDNSNSNNTPTSHDSNDTGNNNGGGDNGNDDKESNDNNKTSSISYKGLQFYYDNMDISSYQLEPMTNDDFNALSAKQKLQVANKLLESLFWGYPLNKLKEKINGGIFISSIYNGLQTETTDKAWLENYITNPDYFKQYKSQWYQPQVIKILTRFYAAKDLDKYYLNNWIAYILTQTILFSPAYELSSTHTPDISQTYNHLVLMLQNGSGMRYITYVHMMSQENWRRFRSPEDNGREMLEIYLQDGKDSDVPLAGKALQNWRLNPDSDTLEVGLNQNTEPLNLFDTTVYTGEDFYRELVKSKGFAKGVTTRLVDFFFPNYSASAKSSIVDKIASSKPETWQDILLQIVLSKEYLLHDTRALSGEETFYSIAKKMHYINRRQTFYYLKLALERMHQASMKYKLGKLNRVPIDAISFAWYHKYLRENILLKEHSETTTDRNSWQYNGWSKDFIANDKFDYDENNATKTLKSFVNYLFDSIISRDATNEEMNFFISHMMDGENFKPIYDMVVVKDDASSQTKEREARKNRVAIIILDYLSRLEDDYMMKGVK